LEDTSESIDDATKDRERPGKPQRVKPTRPTIEPPEVVSVEMSDLEKETYAWMGVSPLVKLGRELNNPKTAIVHVVPVGSLPPEPIVPDPSPAVEAIAAEDISTPESPISQSVEREFTIPVAPPAMTLERAEAAAEVATTPQFTSSDAAIESAQMADRIESETLTAVADVPEELPENRRRKRRSSAIVD
jgi:ribonuclease E